MRYSVFFKKAGGEKTCVFSTMSPDLTLALMNPKVHLAADSAGTFECSLNPNSPAMPESVLERMATKVMVEEYSDHVPNTWSEDESNNEKVIFYGRVLSIDSDFYNTPSLYCEGAYSFLNDTVIMPYTLPKKNGDGTYFTPAQALQKFLQEHNAAVTRAGQNFGIKFETNISEMIVTMKDDLFSGEKNDGSGQEIDNFVVETYTNTREVFENLKKTYGGHFRVHYRKVLPSEVNDYPDQMAIPVLDWIADYNNPKQGKNPDEAEAYIEFGTNLLDLTQKKDGSNIVNCLFLTGKKINSSGNTAIGEEIDVAPMCYYWMVTNDGGLVTSNQNEAVTSTNVHNLRFFADVREGGIYRDPVTLQELLDLGETDMSHVYRITKDPVAANNGWWAYNPKAQNFVNIKDIKDNESIIDGGETFHYGPVTESDFVNGDVIRIGGPVTSDYSTNSFVDPSWNASSKGMAWAWGRYINYVGGTDYVRYDYRTDYTATGLWDSENADHDRPQGPLANSSLQVYGNEIYYYWNEGYSADSINPSLTVLSKNHLRTSSAAIISRSSASAAGTVNRYQSTTINEPTDNNQALYLNLCSLVKGWPNYPSTREQLNMRLWRSRKSEHDEYITLYGIGDHLNPGSIGVPRWYIDSEKYTERGREMTRRVLRMPKRVDQLLIGTPDSDQYFIYPSESEQNVEYYDTNAAFPSIGTTGKYYVDRSTGDVWTYDSNWLVDLNHRAYKVNSYGVEDPSSIAKYGRIEKIVNFSNCTDPATLRDLGAKALFEARLEGVEVNVTALDLSLLKTNVKSPDVLDLIKISSTPHNVKISLPLNERDIPLNDPAQQQYSIGYTGSQKITSTHSGIRR